MNWGWIFIFNKLIGSLHFKSFYFGKADAKRLKKYKCKLLTRRQKSEPKFEYNNNFTF